MKARSIEEAWSMANEIFNTDYMKDDAASTNAGYPVYWSTAEGVNAWISDLGDRLEVNQNGKSINIWIEEEQPEEKKEEQPEAKQQFNFDLKITSHKDGETIERRINDFIIIGKDGTTLSSMASFITGLRKAYDKAIKAIKAGEDIEMSIEKSRYTTAGFDFVDLERDRWTAAPTWEQDPEAGLYFRPDTRYTAEYRDMLLTGRNFFEDLGNTIG